MPPDERLKEWLARWPWLSRFAFFLCGTAAVLSFAPFGAYPLAFALVLPLFYAFLVALPRQSAAIGFAWGAGIFLAGTYWLYVSIHVFGEAPLILALLLMVGLVIIMACYYALAGWAICRLSARSPLRLAIAAPLVWVVLEWLRGWFLSGFPWMTLGYSQIDSPLAAYAPVAGIYGVSLALLVSAAACLAAICSSGGRRTALAIVAVLPWVGGVALAPVAWTEPAGPAVRATIVQGGVSQDRKWLPEQFRPTLRLYRDSIASHADSDLVVWPEVAIPAVLDQVEPFAAALQSELAATDSMLLFGILERDAGLVRVYNSVVALDGKRRQIYRKRHLVPFGEYFPVPEFVRTWMRMLSLPYSDISAGDADQPPIGMPDGTSLAVAICYEDAYAAEQLDALPEAGLLVNVSNDAWFGDSIAPHQHLQIARMRALEAGRAVLRATNNGVSAFIGPRGELIETGPQFEYTAMTRDVVPRRGATPYVRTGNWPVILLTVCGIVLLRVWRIR